MQGMVAGKRSRGKPQQRWEKDIIDTFGTMTAASRVAEDLHQFRSDVLTRICSEKMKMWTITDCADFSFTQIIMTQTLLGV